MNILEMSDIKKTDEMIKDKLLRKKQVIVGIDGRCCSGKTTLAEKIGKRFDAPVIHIDDFFLRPAQRTAERLSRPGGNFDIERLTEEVLIPLKTDAHVIYRPYNCHTQKLEEGIILPKKNVYIIEGAYTCHPAIKEFCDLCIFLTADYKTQLERLKIRDGAALKDFIDKWIPYEEKYFSAFGIMEKCDLVYKT